MTGNDLTEAPGLDRIIRDLRAAVRLVHPGNLTANEAAKLVTAFAEAERLCVAGRTFAARSVERSAVWREQGHRSAAHWIAKETGVAVGQVVGTLEAARRLEHLPSTAEAFRRGELSETKVKEVAAAAAVDPASERKLLNVARSETVASLRETCQRVKAEAAIDEEEAYRRIHQRRYLRHWTDIEGAFRLDARLTADDGARFLATIKRRQEGITREGRKAGRNDSSEAYAADALVSLAREETARASNGPQAMVHVRVDHSALVRGHKVREEVCEIPGLGPIPVSAARQLSSDAILKVLVTEGCDIRAVAHAGRTIPARLRTALEARDPTCAVAGCDSRERLEIDHVIPLAEGGPTNLENLQRLCPWHHYLKTHHGYQLDSVGEQQSTGPDPPIQ